MLKQILFGTVVGLLTTAVIVALSIGGTFKLLSGSQFSRTPVPPALTDTSKCEAECREETLIKSTYGNHIEYNQNMCCQYHRDLRLMLVELNHFCRMSAITYYLSSGTLIGSLRHQSIIPWDADVDVYVPVSPNNQAMTKVHLSETYIKLLSWSTMMPQSKYVLRPGTIKNGVAITSFKLHRRDQMFIDRLNIAGAKIDIQMTVVDKDQTVHIANPYWYQKFAIPLHLIFPLKRCSLYRASYPCPNQSKKYLKLLYGPNVLTHYESKKDFWSTLGGRQGDGPQRRSEQEKEQDSRMLHIHETKKEGDKKIKQSRT